MRKNNHGNAIGYSHTTVNYWHLNYFKSKNYYNTNIFNEEKNICQIKLRSLENQHTIFQNQGVPNKKLVKVESLRYNWLQGHNNTKKIKNNNILILGDYDDEFNIKLLI